MPIYEVIVMVPTSYRIEAKNEHEAKEAVKLIESERTFVDVRPHAPFVISVEEIKNES